MFDTITIGDSEKSLNKNSKKLNYDTGMKYLLSRNDTSYMLNQKIRNQIPDQSERFNTIDCVDNLKEEKISTENEIFISSLMNRLKHNKENEEDLNMGTTTAVLKKNKIKLFKPEKMSELRRKVQLELGDPFLYLNKSLRTDKLLEQTSVISNIFQHNIKFISKISK